MLNYVITVAISAFFVPHYLSIFWEPLRTNPWDIDRRDRRRRLLVGINIVGIKEAAALNVVLAVVDFATQLLLVVARLRAHLQPAHPVAATSTGASRRRGASFALAIPVAMIAYTGIETVSNLAEEARDPRRSIPGRSGFVAVAVFAIYFTLPLVALSALPVYKAAGQLRHEARPGPAGGLQERPGARARREPRPARRAARRREDLRRRPRGDDPLHRHERRRDRRVADHLLDGELPAAARASSAGCTRASRRRGSSLVVFAGVFSILFLLPGRSTSSGGCTRSARCSRSRSPTRRSSQMRRKPPPSRSPTAPGRTSASAASTGRSSPSSAASARRSPGSSSSSRTRRRATPASAGSPSGSSSTPLYRRRIGVPLPRRSRAPIAARPRDGARVPHDPRADRRRASEADEAIDLACRLAAERGATIVALRVIVVPMELPLDASCRTGGRGATELLDEARDRGDDLRRRVSAASSARARRPRDRRRGRAARSRDRRPRRAARPPPRTIFGNTVDYVLKFAPCRVMVAAGKKAA